MMSKEIDNIELLKKLRDTLPIGKERTRMSVIISNYMHMERTLTPPTEQEVCEALSEYYDVKIMFENNEFYYKGRANNIRIVGLTARKANDEVIKICVDFYPDFPPHLVEMIGKFYKGKVKE